MKELKSALVCGVVWGSLWFSVFDAVAEKAEAPAGGSAAERVAKLNEIVNWQRVNPEDYAGVAEELLKEWASVEPRAAMEFALRSLTDDNTSAIFLDAAGSVLETWAKRDPVAARLFFEGLGSETAARVLAPSMMQGYASKAPESALVWVHAEMDGQPAGVRETMARTVMEAFVTQGRSELIKSWLLQNGSGNATAEAMIPDLTRRLARSNPAEALAFVDELPKGGASRGSALREAVRQWASGDPDGARRWLAAKKGAESPGGQDRPDPAVAGSDLDEALVGFALGVAGADPTRALAEVSSISDGPARGKAVEKLKVKR